MLKKFAFSDIFRLVVIAVISVAMVLWVPSIVERPDASLSSPMFTVILFMFLTGFLISQTINRNAKLAKAMSIELSRLRRLVHLTENMDASVKWRRTVRQKVVDYLEAVSQTDFRRYDRAHEKFRLITHEMYAFKPKSDRDTLMWQELLEVTRDAAYQRQQVATYLHSEISPYTWVAALLLLLINLWLMLAAREPGLSSILFISGAVMGLILVIDILFKLDFPTRRERGLNQALYAQNAKDMKHEDTK